MSIYLSIYIYIYIYIYCHPQTDCFIISQLYSVARHVGPLRLGSKPVQLYVRLSIRPLGQQAYHVGKGIIRYYVATVAAAFVCLHFLPYRTPKCSIRSKIFVLCERLPKIPSSECSYIWGAFIRWWHWTLKWFQDRSIINHEHFISTLRNSKILLISRLCTWIPDPYKFNLIYFLFFCWRQTEFSLICRHRIGNKNFGIWFQ